MSFFFFPLILCILDLIYTKDNTSELYKYNKEIYLRELFNGKEIIIEMLKEIEANRDIFYNNLIESPEDVINLMKTIFGEKINIFIPILKDILNRANPFLNRTFDVLCDSTNDVTHYIIKILNESEKGDSTFLFVMDNLRHILKVPEVRVLIYDFYSKYNDSLIPIFEIFTKDTNAEILFNMTKNFLKTYQDELFGILYNITANVRNRTGVTILVRDFIYKNFNNTLNRSILLEELGLLLQDEDVIGNLTNIIDFGDTKVDIITKELLRNKQLMNLTFKLLYNQKLVESLSEIIIRLNDKAYIKTHIPDFFNDLLGNNERYYTILLDIVKTVLFALVKKQRFNQFISYDLMKLLKDIFFDENNPFFYSINRDCFELFNYTFFSEFHRNISEFKYFYSKKFFLETTKNRNDFLTYENCLSGNYTLNYDKKYKIKPIFIVGKINDPYNKNNLKSSIYYDKFNYLQSLCFPYGTNSNTGEVICKKEDYDNLIKSFSLIVYNMNTSSVDSFYMDAENIKVKSKDYLYFILNLIIIFFPLLIKLFLKFCQFRYEKLYKKSEIINYNEPIVNTRKKSDEIIKENNSNISIKYPKNYELLNKYFDITKNWEELFNFTSKVTDFNDFNGITYIKGILGISIFLNIFGLTFFIMINLPHKILGSYQFYDTITNPFYIIPFIGLRYAPRLIFSCSGYTLIYKYLFFIEQNTSYFFFKFLISNSYKYLLLIIIALFIRYLLYYIDIIFREKKSMIFELFKFNLGKNDNNYFFNLFSLLFYNLSKKEFENNESIIQYLYLPINEVFLFIFGISLISLGYKYKLRIDLIIIILIISIYLGKVIIFFSYFYKEKLYATLYFFLSDFGGIMLNPIFNLPSFLIGMYFGLVNYIIQRGVNNSDYNSQYQRLETIETKRTLQEKENRDKDDYLEHNNDFNISYNENSSKDKQVNFNMTYNYESNSPFEKKEENAFNYNKSYEVEFDKKKENEDFKLKSDNLNIIEEMPFLKFPMYFTNFHRTHQDTSYSIIIFILFLIMISFFISVRYVLIYCYVGKNINNEKIKKVESLSFDEIIPNIFLNIIYLLDIELVVFFVHLICFLIYFKGSQINDFLDSIYWSFFIKSYFSYALISSPVILYIFYQSETVIRINIYNIILYSFISLILIFICVIIFYAFYEFPMKKMFKNLIIDKNQINLDNEDLDDYYFDDESSNNK